MSAPFCDSFLDARTDRQAEMKQSEFTARCVSGAEIAASYTTFIALVTSLAKGIRASCLQSCKGASDIRSG
jgi:hypothetical protein